MKALPIPSGQNEGIGNAFKALPMPSGKDEGTTNFPYQILLVKFHLQYRNVECWTEFFGYFNALETYSVFRTNLVNYNAYIKRVKCCM